MLGMMNRKCLPMMMMIGFISLLAQSNRKMWRITKYTTCNTSSFLFEMKNDQLEGNSTSYARNVRIKRLVETVRKKFV